MKRELLAFGCVALTALVAASDARAQGPGKTAPAPSASGTGVVRAGPIASGASLPPGHPGVVGGGEGEEPHAAGEGHGGAGGDPHGGGQQGGGGMADIPEDSVAENAAVPVGAVELLVTDPAGKPLGKTTVTLGIVYNSVAKGESRKRVTQQTDDAGLARFTNLETGSGVAYRPMVLKDGATFSVTPFGLSPKSGIRALLHVYPVVNDVEQAMIASQTMIYAEVKDDRIQIQQAFKIYNFGRTAWVPTDVVIPLPETYTAFAAQQGMTDVGVDAVPLKGVKLRGTFSPGQHVIEFKWQLPYAGDSDVKFDVGMTPHLASARVVAPASKGMGMEVDGFEPTKSTTDGTGQRALVTEKQLRREDAPVNSVRVTIKGLPTEGPGKVLASILALGGIVMGLVLGSRKTPPRDTKREREQLLAALEGLEVGHREGTIGPKTYERARRELIDDLARSFAEDPKPVKKSPRKRPA